MSLEWGQPGLFALLLTEGIASDTAVAAEAEVTLTRTCVGFIDDA